MLKPPQTCDKKGASRSFRRRRATKIKLAFLRWIWTKKKNFKSIGNSCVFSILAKSFKKYDFGMRFSKQKISAAALLYIISTITLRKALQVMLHGCCESNSEETQEVFEGATLLIWKQRKRNAGAMKAFEIISQLLWRTHGCALYVLWKLSTAPHGRVGATNSLHAGCCENFRGRQN